MDMSQLKPASELAKHLGVKSVVYGAPGTGKTPIIKTAPRPVVLLTEPGLLSMRDAHNIPVWDATSSADRIDEFFDWLLRSPETKNFDTVCIDSVSQMAEIILRQEQDRNKDGRKAYGELSRRAMDFMNQLYFMPEKHVYMVAKMAFVEENGVSTRKPYFPGQDLNVKVPHLFDEIFHVGEAQVQGQPQPVVAMRTKTTFGIMARDRSGRLAELEPTDLGQIFNKCMS